MWKAQMPTMNSSPVAWPAFPETFHHFVFTNTLCLIAPQIKATSCHILWRVVIHISLAKLGEMCRQNITNGNIWLWLIIERMEFSKKNMAKLWPQPPHNHFRIFIWICILISFLRSRKNMSNTLLSIRIWGYYQLYQCSVFTKSRGNIFVTRLELRRDQ